MVRGASPLGKFKRPSKRYNAELEDLREKTDKELTSIKETVLKMEKSIRDQGAQLQQCNDHYKTEFATIRADMANMFQDSLQKSLAGHDQEMSSQFAEFKELLAAKTRSSPQPKRVEQDDANL